MSKENTNTCSISLEINTVKRDLIAGKHPTMSTKLPINRLVKQYYVVRTPAQANAPSFSALGVDVEKALAECEAFIAIASSKTAAQFDARQLSVEATRERDAAVAGLVAAKESLILLARASGTSTTPYDMPIATGSADPLSTGYALKQAVCTHGHLLSPAPMVEALRQEIEHFTAMLDAASKAQQDRKASSMATTQEKTLAKNALMRALKDLSRYGQIVFRHDRQMKSAFVLSLLTPKPSKKTPVAVGVSTVDEEDAVVEVEEEEIVVSPVEVTPAVEEVEEVVVN
jgi:hypothetical protein